MELESSTSPNSESNVTQTGYRALFVLLKLIESPKSRTELLESFEQDSILNKELSKDTVTNTINALRLSGCIISRPSQRTNNKYILKSHLFKAYLSDKNIKALQELRKSLITFSDWVLLLKLNEIYAILAEHAPTEKGRNILLHNHPFSKINIGILNELLVCIKYKKLINITYNSPKHGEETLGLIPDRISFENEKLYVWGYCYKYNQISYLKVDRITRINFVNLDDFEAELAKLERDTFYAEYELRGHSATLHSESEFETIIEKDDKKEYSLRIRAKVTNKFNFMQRILFFANDCRIISPESFKTEVFNKLKEIKALYGNKE